MRTNIVPDDDSVQQGFALTGRRTRRAPVHLALSELVRRRRKDLLDLAGKVKLRPDFDHKAMRRVRGDRNVNVRVVPLMTRTRAARSACRGASCLRRAFPG